METNKINLDSPTSNMFGIEPCPKCGSEFRIPTWDGDGNKIIQCDDCHLIELQDNVNN